MRRALILVAAAVVLSGCGGEFHEQALREYLAQQGITGSAADGLIGPTRDACAESTKTGAEFLAAQPNDRTSEVMVGALAYACPNKLDAIIAYQQAHGL